MKTFNRYLTEKQALRIIRTFVDAAKRLLENDPYISFWDLLAEHKVIPPIRQPRPSPDIIEASGYRHDGNGNLIGKSGRILTGSPKTCNNKYGKKYMNYTIRIRGYGRNGSGSWSMMGHTLIFGLVHRRWPRDGFVIDHIDNDGLNNHPDNLREITPYENQHYVKKAKKNIIILNKINGTQTTLLDFFN